MIEKKRFMILIIFTPNYGIATETPTSVRPSEDSYSESSGTENGAQKRRRCPNGHVSGEAGIWSPGTQLLLLERPAERVRGLV